MFFKKRVPELPPEWIIVGLGNPGAEYRGTRHNVGFEVIDALAKRHGIKLARSKNKALYGCGAICGRGVLLVKPLTYMNLSGQAVAPFARQSGIPPDRILVVADDMDLNVGRVRLKPKGSAGGHNGHKSIIQCLGTSDYPRLKIGIGAPKSQSIEHVLSRFEPDEVEIVRQAVQLAVQGCEAVVKWGLERAMNAVNAAGSAHHQVLN